MRIKIFDSNQNELDINDIVGIECHNIKAIFYAKVQFVNSRLYPFDFHYFNTIKKIDKLPGNIEHIEKTEYLPEYWIKCNSKDLAIRDDVYFRDYQQFKNNRFYEISESK